MAIRQYVGARYVPRFTGLYDATQVYDALDVVDNGSGTSYIAKKTVPAGTPLTDTDYWFVYGSTSGAILNLQDQIDNMQDGDIPGSLQNQLDIINHGLNGPIFTDWNTRKILFLSDSYGQGTICTGRNPDTYTNNYEDGWMYKLITLLGMDSDHAIPQPTVGASFAHPSGVHWQDAIQSLPDDPDLNMIFIAGGANDLQASGYNAIINGINAFFTVARSKFPNAVVVIAEIGFSRWSGSVISQPTVMNAYKNGAISNGGVYLSKCYNVMHNAELFSLDDLHGTAQGYTDIARALYGELTSGGYEYWSESFVDFTPTLANSTAIYWSRTQAIHDNIMTMDIAYNIYCDPTAFVLNNNNWHKLGDLSNNNIIGRTDTKGVIAPATIGLRESGKYYFFGGYVAVKESSLYFNALDYDNTGNAWRTITADNIQIHNARFVVDTCQRE